MKMQTLTHALKPTTELTPNADNELQLISSWAQAH